MKKLSAAFIFLGFAVGGFLHGAPVDSGPRLGLQTWTCRDLSFEQTVEFAVKHRLTHLQLISAHLSPTASREETLRKKAILKQHGLTAYSFGVNRTSQNKEQNRKLFEFARLMEMDLIIVEPENLAEWDTLEELVKEYDIKLAIHNHGAGTIYGDPATVRRVLAERDPRIGVCLDVGWVTAAGFDAATVFQEYGDRVFDLHFKDKTVEIVDGVTVAIDCEIGRGAANYEGLVRLIRDSGWSGIMAIEIDSRPFGGNPNIPVASAREYFEKHFASKRSGSK